MELNSQRRRPRGNANCLLVCLLPALLAGDAAEQAKPQTSKYLLKLEEQVKLVRDTKDKSARFWFNVQAEMTRESLALRDAIGSSKAAEVICPQLVADDPAIRIVATLGVDNLLDCTPLGLKFRVTEESPPATKRLVEQHLEFAESIARAELNIWKKSPEYRYRLCQSLADAGVLYRWEDRSIGYLEEELARLEASVTADRGAKLRATDVMTLHLLLWATDTSFLDAEAETADEMLVAIRAVKKFLFDHKNAMHLRSKDSRLFYDPAFVAADTVKIPINFAQQDAPDTAGLDVKMRALRLEQPIAP